MKRVVILSISLCLLNFATISVLAEPMLAETKPVIEVSADAQAFVQAARVGNLLEVKRLQGAGLSLESKVGSEHSTALIEAAKHGHIKIVGFLLDAGANVAQKDVHGNSVLMQGVKARDLELVKLLKQNGADLNDQNLMDETVLMAACSIMGNKDIVRYLLSKSSNSHASSKDGSTALHFSAASGADSALRTLIMYEVDLNAQNKKGMTALMLLAGNADTNPVNRVKMATSLVQKGAKYDLKNASGQTALDLAKAAKETGLVAYLESL